MRTDYSVSAEQNAVNLRRDLDIPTSAAIDFPYIFDNLHIHFRKEPLKRGILGACKVEGLKKLIVVSSEIVYPSQERFTIAHELGHVILHHGYSRCRHADIFETRTKSAKESEANRFASALLLPPAVIKERASSGDITISMAEEIANHYAGSLTATIIALIKASPLSVCAFFQSKDRIDYSVCSAECVAVPNSGPVALGVDIHTVSRDIRERTGRSDYECWFKEQPGADFICSEETKFFAGLNTAISIVHVWEKD